jgi:hypothetical protein
MTRISITRLRLRSRWFELPFIWHAVRSQRQARSADGCLGVNVRRTKGAVYWTITVWRNDAALRAFMLSGAHRQAMPKLINWCDEASVAHWPQETDTLPSWEEGERRLAAEGRLSKVAHPSSAQRAGQTLPA